jgi:8-oxo-dGTP pyrophosphatase MutT (NUDIX family)
MHRAAALAWLRAHEAGPLDPLERAMVADAIVFINSHPDGLVRSCLTGHLTGSSWILNPARTHTVLVLHRKLDRWLNPGGHADGDPDLLAVALREAREESGLTVRAPAATLFDFDRHWIPERPTTPGHWHYDFRFLLEADPAESLQISSESKDLRWFDLAEVPKLNSSESMARLLRKTAALQKKGAPLPERL